jgi:hypothetical protein
LHGQEFPRRFTGKQGRGITSTFHAHPPTPKSKSITPGSTG